MTRTQVEFLSLSALGDFPKEWEETTLVDICDLVTDGTHDSPKPVKYGGYPLVTGKAIKNRQIDFSVTYNISDADHQKVIERSKPDLDDILFANIGNSIGDLVRIQTNQSFSIKNVALFKLDYSKVYPKFLEYFLLSPQVQSFIKGSTRGSAQPFIGLSSLRGFPISLPAIDEQMKIGNLLATLDDRITLLRETNQTLEAIAQAIFKSWFVNFDPVRAKQEGKKPEGMDEATASLFPDNFEQSELGEIPKGWYYGKIGDVATVKSGFAFKGQSFSDSGLPVIKIKNILGDGTVDLQNIQYIKSNIANVNKKFSLNDGDIIIAMTGATIGKTGIVVKDELTPYLNQRVAKFDKKLDGPNNGWFIYTAFQNKNISEQVLNIASGSAQPNISTSGIESIRLIIPTDLTIIDIFNTFSSSLFENWILNHKKITTLSKIFDNLLPRLISGQIRLSDEEEINSKIKVDA